MTSAAGILLSRWCFRISNDLSRRNPLVSSMFEIFKWPRLPESSLSSWRFRISNYLSRGNPRRFLRFSNDLSRGNPRRFLRFSNDLSCRNLLVCVLEFQMTSAAGSLQFNWKLEKNLGYFDKGKGELRIFFIKMNFFLHYLPILSHAGNGILSAKKALADSFLKNQYWDWEGGTGRKRLVRCVGLVDLNWTSILSALCSIEKREQGALDETWVANADKRKKAFACHLCHVF